MVQGGRKRAAKVLMGVLALGITGMVQVDAPATAVSTAAIAAMPARGEHGAGVVRLQQALIAAGVAVPGGADGAFGGRTEDALRRYQESAGLPATGVVDDATVRQLGLTLPARGDRSDDVTRLQQALSNAGHPPPGGADGVFGGATEQALKDFQAGQGLPATGVLDPATAVALHLDPRPRANASAPATPTGTTVPGGGTTASTDGVKRVQAALIAAGVAVPGGADGVFGPKTGAALRSFQSTKGLNATGELDEATRSALGLAIPVRGDRGAEVTRLQEALIAKGVTLVGGADGIFGSSTASAIATFQQQAGLSATGAVDEATANALGFGPAPTARSAAATVSVPSLAVFPVQGRCAYGKSWHQQRPGGRLHKGVDIIANQGNLLYAVVDGTISNKLWDIPGRIGGNQLRLTAGDGSGTYYIYAHMLDFAPGIAKGSQVKAGQVIGYVGNTGESAGPHLHFEVHPNGGSAVDPYEILRVADACAVTEPRPMPS